MKIMITKGQLREYMKNRVASIREELHKEINTKIDNKIDPLLDNLIDTKEVEEMAAKLRNQLEKTFEKHGLTSWEYSSTITKLNLNAVDLGKTIRRNVKSEISYFVHNPSHRTIVLNLKELEKPAQELQKSCDSLVSKLIELSKLSRDVEKVISIEPTGKRAYKALIALGVDMKDFEAESKQNLPAIVKLSSDVCLLNKTC
jgi:ribosomal protein L31E